MTVSSYIVGILALIAIFFAVGIIIGTIVMSWKSRGDEKNKTEAAESFAKTAVSVVIIVIAICIAIYLCVQ